MGSKDEERVSNAIHAQALGQAWRSQHAEMRETTFMTVFATYPNEDSARQAMRAHGTGAESWLLVGRAVHDTRRESVGGFAGPVAPHDLVGSYGNRPLERWRGHGTFAGDADAKRQGSFADTDRIVVVTESGGAERSHVTGERGVRKLLARSTLSDEAIERAIGELRAGHAVVVVDSTVMAPSDPVAKFEHVQEAA
jgi:hypothetical protein